MLGRPLPRRRHGRGGADAALGCDRRCRQELRGLSRRVNDLPYYTLSQRAQEIATGVASDPEAGERFEPSYLDHDSELYLDLAQETEIGFISVFDLSARPWDVLQSNVLGSFPYLLLILFVVASSYYQQRQVSSRRGAVPDNPTPQQQTQQQLLRILPLMSGIWSFLFPAGLVLYWATSNVFRIGQQAYITRALYSEDGEGTKAMEAAKASTDDSDDDGDSDEAGDDDDRGVAAGGRDGGRSSSGSSGGKRKTSGRGAGSDRSNGKSGSSDRGGSTNGSSRPETAADRNEAWARRRAERARTKTTKTTKKPSGAGGSSGGRVTAKGTKPADQRKKRKR